MLAIVAAPANAAPPKVLVFTGTTGGADASTAPAVTAIQTLGGANGFTVDTSASASSISAANLAQYRAVIFVNSVGDVLDATQEGDLKSYVEGGGGFMGIGSTVKLEEAFGPNSAFFATLIGARPDGDTSIETPTSFDVEFSDRAHPASSGLPMLWAGHSDKWYGWLADPVGSVETIARVRTSTSGLTDDPTRTNTPQARTISWCRDVSSGRSFITAMGRVASAYSEPTFTAHLLGAIQWASGMSRGNCKATISSSYTGTRLTVANTAGQHNQVGEMHGLSIADDGRVFYIGRASCTGISNPTTPNASGVSSWYPVAGDLAQPGGNPTLGLGCGDIHVWDPNKPGTDPQKVDKIGSLAVFGNRGNGGEELKAEMGLQGILLDPDFTNGRPYIYLQYYPYSGVNKLTAQGERRISRFTYDNNTKTLVPGSEKIIFMYRTQVYSCCHVGGDLAMDSAGNLYIAMGDNIGNGPSSGAAFSSTNAGNQTGCQPVNHYTVPIVDRFYPANANLPAGVSPAGNYALGAIGSNNVAGGNYAPRDASCPATVYAAQETGAGTGTGRVYPLLAERNTFGDARYTSGNTNWYDGKMLRIHPLANPGDLYVDDDHQPSGVGTTYTIPGAGAPNGANLFDETLDVTDKTKPEIYAMGTRNLFRTDVDPNTDMPTGGWVGPDAATVSSTWGNAQSDTASIMPVAGNYSAWPYCAGNLEGYRVKTGGTAPGVAAPYSGEVGTIPGGANPTGIPSDGAFYDCNHLENHSPYNTGLVDIPDAKRPNLWWGPSGGCFDWPRNSYGTPIYANSNTDPSDIEYCRWAGRKHGGGGQAAFGGPTYDYQPTGSDSVRWPEYWDGMWIVYDYSATANMRHAVRFTPAQITNGLTPVHTYNLASIITNAQFGGSAMMDAAFGPDGALYVENYGGSFFTITGTTALWRYSYTGGPETPGPDPSSSQTGNKSWDFSTGKSGGMSYDWDFGDGAHSSATNPSHTFATPGPKQVQLTVTYADGENASKTIQLDPAGDPPVNTSPPVLSGPGNVGAALSCSSGSWTESGSYSYVWKNNGTPFAPDQPKQYTPVAGDVGDSITCEVTRTNSSGPSAPAASNAIVVSANPVPSNVSPPTITGSSSAGQKLKCNTGTWTSTGPYSYSWSINNGTPFVTPNPKAYFSTLSDVGKSVRCIVVRTNSNGASAPSTSAPVVVTP